MGYSVEAYLVDLDQLGRVYGSRDLQLVRTIEQHRAGKLARLNGFVEETNAGLEEDHDPDRDGRLILCPSVNTALRGYVAGTIIGPTDYALSSYRFALKLICAALGVALPDQMFHMLRPFGVAFIHDDVRPIADVVFRSPPLGPRPFPEDWKRDWYVGHLAWEQAAAQLANWQTVIVSDDPDNRMWEEGVCNQYRGWLEEAIRLHMGIVTFFD
jgi:hypothetical protein